jgi:hypothetical protein
MCPGVACTLMMAVMAGCVSSQAIDKVIERLKKQAARLGANGVLLHGVGARSAGSIRAGVGTESESGHSPYGLGFGASVFLTQESGGGVALYVEPQ